MENFRISKIFHLEYSYLNSSTPNFLKRSIPAAISRLFFPVNQIIHTSECESKYNFRFLKFSRRNLFQNFPSFEIQICKKLGWKILEILILNQWKFWNSKIFHQEYYYLKSSTPNFLKCSIPAKMN